jgi:hypothetical protein
MAERKEIDLVINTQVNGGENLDQSVDKVKTLKQQIKEAKLEVEQFEEGSEGFKKAAANVAALSDKLDDVNDQVKLLKGDALERVAGGFKGVGSAILDLDVGKLKIANESLKSIKFGDLIGNAKAFGKELLTLATNPFFLIPALIGLIIANFDKLLKIFPGLGAIVDGVKVIFDGLVDAVLGLINYAGELYAEFKPIIDVLFPIIGIISAITDLIVEQGNTAEAQAERRVAAEEKYKDSVEESNKSLGESRRRILVATGKISEEEAARQKAKEDFITNYLKAQEEARVLIKDAANNEEKEVIKKNLDLKLKALQEEYKANLVEINKGEKDKNDAKAESDKKARQDAADKAKAARDKEAADNLKDTEAFNQKLKQTQLTFATDEEKINEETRKKIADFDKAFAALTDQERKDRQSEYLSGLLDIELEGQQKINKIKEESDKAQEAKNKERLDKEKAALTDFTSTLTGNLEERLTEEERIQSEGNQRKLELQAQFDALSAEEQLIRKQQFDDELKAIDKDTKDQLDLQSKESSENQAKIEEDLNKKKLDAVKNTLSTISSLAELFAGKSRKQQEKAFKVQKAVSIAQASISTAEAAISAYKSLAGIPVIGPALGALASAAAIAAGLVQIKKIKEQKFEGGGPEPSPSPTPTPIDTGGGTVEGSGGGGLIAPPRFNLRADQIGGAGSLLGMNGQSNQNQPVRVYVTESDITNTQNKVQVVQGNSLFGSGGG